MQQRRQIANTIHIIRFAPVYHILPDEHAKAVTVVIPAHRLQLAVLAQQAEAALLHSFDITYERLIAWGRIQSLRPVALVKHPI